MSLQHSHDTYSSLPELPPRLLGRARSVLGHCLLFRVPRLGYGNSGLNKRRDLIWWTQRLGTIREIKSVLVPVSPLTPSGNLFRKQQSGSGLGTSLWKGKSFSRARWEGRIRGQAPSSRPPPGAGMFSPPMDERHTASLETRSPFIQADSGVLGHGGRPSFFNCQ